MVFVIRKNCEANPDFTREYWFVILYYSLKNINYPWLLQDFIWFPEVGKNQRLRKKKSFYECLMIALKNFNKYGV